MFLVQPMFVQPLPLFPARYLIEQHAPATPQHDHRHLTVCVQSAHDNINH